MTGRHMLELGLPSWSDVEIWNPATVSWPLPFLGLGLAWLLARRSTRFFGLVAGGFYAAFVAASALGVYPLGTGRPDIFAFRWRSRSLPRVSTSPRWRSRGQTCFGWPPQRRSSRSPWRIRCTRRYWDVDDAGLVDALAPDLRPDDGLIISPSGAFLVAFYGRWPVTITATTRHSHGTLATIGRDRTLYLFRGPAAGRRRRPVPGRGAARSGRGTSPFGRVTVKRR